MNEALTKKGFTFVEIITPCPIIYLRRNRLGDGLKEMNYYKDNSEICHDADTREVELDFRGKIKIGKFVDREKPTYSEAMEAHLRKVMGDKYVPYEGVQ
jgi:2-oxoglutarate ferredoxin oxidoreductase subunit beta